MAGTGKAKVAGARLLSATLAGPRLPVEKTTLELM
jgi:hypothetical protein